MNDKAKVKEYAPRADNIYISNLSIWTMLEIPYFGTNSQTFMIQHYKKLWSIVQKLKKFLKILIFFDIVNAIGFIIS